MPLGRGIPFRAGDVIGFAGRDVGSAIIAVGTWGIPGWSLTHVGIVAESPEEAGDLLLFEATAALEMDCVLQQRRIAGIQAHRIEERIARYHGRAWHYPLARPLGDEQSFALATFCVQNLGVAYDFPGAWRARQAGFGWLWRLLGSEEDLSSLFCSEFVAAGLTRAEVWDAGNASSWSPRYLGRRLLADGIVRNPVRMK